jgi:flagellar motor switch protein FliN/FliY
MEGLKQKILETLGEQFSLALEGMLGEKWEAKVTESALPSDPSEYLCWNQKLNVHKEPVLQVVTKGDVWREIGTKALEAVGLEDPEEADVRSTYFELLTQALAGLARFLSGEVQREVTLESGGESEIPASGVPTQYASVLLTSPGGFEAELMVRVAPTLMLALSPEAPDPAKAAASESPTQQVQKASAGVSGGGGGAGGSYGGGQAPPTMEMLLDVELPVAVSFGRTHMALKEVIKLSTGSIIELNRTITEPVEVIVNNCVVARGEVVVIEGNYGVRIQQIVSRSERLKSID